MSVSLHSKLELIPLKLQADKKNIIVEDILSGEFYEMPAVCVDAITMINEDLPLYQVEEVLSKDIQMNRLILSVLWKTC